MGDRLNDYGLQAAIDAEKSVRKATKALRRSCRG